MLSIFSYDLSYGTLFLLIIVSFFIGMAKTGVHGVSMFSIPLLAIIFGGKSSSGLMLPMLIIADVLAVLYYHRSANWHYLKKLFPATALGVVLGTFTGQYIDDQAFRSVMLIIIFLSLGLMLWQEKYNKIQIPDYAWLAAFIGLLGGFTSMVGNLAGVVMALYLLCMKLPKDEYIGTAAWFFLVLNLFKVPFHIFSWQTITLDSFYLNLSSIPFITLGAVAGVYIVKKIPETYYRWLVITMTAIAAITMAT